MMWKRIGIILAGILLLLLIGVYEILWAPNTFEGDRFINVSKGETYRQVVDSLVNAGIVRSRLLLEIAGRLEGYTTRMQIGRYRFTSGMSNKEILNDIRFGLTAELITVTLPEGWRASRMARHFGKVLGIDSVRFMELVDDPAFVHQLGVNSTTLEGYLMPKTYRFYWQTDEADIIKTLVNEFWTEFNDSLRAAATSRNLSINDVVTMASIIEMETSIDVERPVIAGVYYNRLKKGMRLQADPTIQYILEEGPRRLRWSDLYRQSSYNTYRNAGLPPTPINNPGIASIKAAIYPAKHKYLFFVATGQGGHRFASTFAEHKKNIQLYRKYREEQSIRAQAEQTATTN